jgi:hypothetical protein
VVVGCSQKVVAVTSLYADPDSYQRSSLHSEHRDWPEKNCYVDVCIGLVHSLGLSPEAMLGSAIAVDFEGDQWTFYKPSHHDLFELYGIDVQELTVWRPLLEHVLEHVVADKLIATEADSFYLPDTSATDYQRNHVKTTIVIAQHWPAEKRLAYFHNAGFYWLLGDDYDQLFAARQLPLYAELIRTDRVKWRSLSELHQIARTRLQQHVDRAPVHNPFERFAKRFAQDLPMLQSRGLAHYHLWAFATTRQLGVAAELSSAHLAWLAVHTTAVAQQRRWLAASVAFQEISSVAKSFILKAARSVNSQKPLDAAPLFAGWSDSWQRAMVELRT